MKFAETPSSQIIVTKMVKYQNILVQFIILEHFTMIIDSDFNYAILYILQAVEGEN